MNYIRSKKSLLKFLEASIYKVIGKNSFIMLDLFAGTGIVGQHFKQLGNQIIANDLQYYSYVLNKNYIENHEVLTFENLSKTIDGLYLIEHQKRTGYVCDYLNKTQDIEGFIYKKLLHWRS